MTAQASVLSGLVMRDKSVFREGKLSGCTKLHADNPSFDLRITLAPLADEIK